MSVRPGKTAPRLLQDLLTYDPRYEHGFGRNVLSDAPPLFDPSIQPSPLAVPPQGCRHALMAKYTQCKLAEPGETPDTSTVYKVASYCNQCRFHFDITVDFGGQLYNGHPCPNDDFPLHHFLYMPDRNQSSAGPPLTPEERTYRFQCSAKDCPVELRIRIRPPIFKTAWVDLLTNQGFLEARLRAAQQADPERAELRAAKPTDGLYYLGRYLGDALDSEHNKKKIPLRNRKFMVTFGQDCDTMLRELGFEREETEDGINWNLPNAGPLADPLEGDTLRTKLEDVMEELNALLLKRPSSEQKTIAYPPRQPIPCLKDIERALGCLEYSRNASSRRSQNRDAPEHPYYAGLGALVSFADNLIIFAFERQAENDPMNAPYYFECLEDLSQGRESEELQLKVMTLMSQGQTNRKQIREAYKYFNIDPDMSASSDTFIINQFRARLSDVSSKQEGEMREMLRVLGQARQSSDILQEASNAIETFAQANSYLGVEESTDIDYIATMAQLKAGESESSKASVHKAIQIIANHRNSDSLRSFLTTGQLGETEMDLAEAYRILDIPDRTQRLDQEFLQTLLELRTADSIQPADKLQKAYALISKSQFGQADDDTVQESKYPLDKWPVGFQNIGNTCYLNSLLQYFFTIKPLRRLVLDFEKYKLELTEENTFKKRVGGREVSVEEVEKAQEFVRELKKLFEGMIKSPGPSVRPEVRLACLALLSSKDETSEKPVSNGESSVGLGTLGGMPVSGPMLPPSQIGLPESGNTSSSHTEVGDAGSEGTLVGDASNSGSPKFDAIDGQNDIVEIKPRVPGGTDLHQTSQMSIDNEASESDAESVRAVNGEAAPEPPTRPPPVPPRPKQVDTARTTVPADVEFAARQQDVAEVMNKVVFQLQCAIRPQVLANGESVDLTKRLFFGETTTTHTRKNKTEQRKEAWDTLFVNVNEGPRDIYSALDEEFDVGDIEEESQQTADNGILRKYENISTLPPILQINVKRVNYDSKKKEAFKSHNHLHLEPTLFVDRYLEQTPEISREELFERRLKSWEWKKQLKVHRQRLEELKALENGLEMADTVDVAADFISGLATPPHHEDGNSSPTTESALSLSLKKRAVELRQEQQGHTEQITTLQYNIHRLFADLRNQPYQLHAIFIHRGSAGGGHYYVYIRDFQQNVWRKYNDTKVDEVVDLDEIFAEDKNRPPATSTGVVYVRDDEKEWLTEALCRDVPVERASEAAGADVEMIDVDGIKAQVLEGVEI